VRVWESEPAVAGTKTTTPAENVEESEVVLPATFIEVDQLIVEVDPMIVEYENMTINYSNTYYGLFDATDE